MGENTHTGKKGTVTGYGHALLYKMDSDDGEIGAAT